MNRLNIGFVTTWFERGAGYVTQAYIELLKNENNIFVFARGGIKYEKETGPWNADYVHYGKRVALSETTGISAKEIFKWLEANRIDVLFFNEQNDFLPIYKIRNRFPKVKIGGYIDYYKYDTVKRFDIYDFLICNTKRHYEVFSWHPQCFYIPWGTDTELFKPSLTKEVDKITFFHSQGYSNRKGTASLINTFIKYKLYRLSNLIIHTQNNLINIQDIPHSDLSDYNIKIINKTVTAPGLYHLGNIYVYPTMLEGIGLTVIEALSCGLPTIVPDYPPMNEFVTETTGKLVKIKRLVAREDGYYWPLCIVDDEDLASKMEYYIKNVDSIDKYRSETRNYAVNKFNWGQNRENVNCIFKETKLLDNYEIHDLEKIIKKNRTKSKQRIITGIFDTYFPDFLKDRLINRYRYLKQKGNL